MSKLTLNQRVKNVGREVYRKRVSYLMMAPFLVLFFLFVVWPVIYSMAMSFTSYNVFGEPRWIFADNYVKLLFKDDLFLTALQNTILFAIITGPVGYILCLFFAWLVNELEGPLKAIMTTILYAPSIAGNAFVIWRVFFDGDVYGYLNSFLLQFGFVDEPIQWLSDPTYMMTIVIIVQLWMSLGTSFLTLRAGFNTIDRTYYEAAAMDGLRNRWQELWFITLPMMKPHLMLSAVLSITGAFGSGFVAEVLCGKPSTNYATYLLIHHLQEYATVRYQRGYASAIATVLFLMSIVVNALAKKFLGKVGE